MHHTLTGEGDEDAIVVSVHPTCRGIVFIDLAFMEDNSLAVSMVLFELHKEREGKGFSVFSKF